MASYFGNTLPNSLATANDIFGAATAVANAVNNVMTSSSNSSSSSSSSSSNNHSSLNSESSQANQSHNRLQSNPNQQQHINSQLPIQNLNCSIETTNHQLLNLQEVEKILKYKIFQLNKEMDIIIL